MTFRLHLGWLSLYLCSKINEFQVLKDPELSCKRKFMAEYGMQKA